MVIDIGRDSHSVSDHTQGNWNGIVGRVELRTTPQVWIDELQVRSSADGFASLSGRIGNVSGEAGQGELTVTIVAPDRVGPSSSAAAGPVRLTATWQPDGGSFQCTLRVPSARLWDEFSTPRYQAEAALESTGKNRHVVKAPFAFREFGIDGTQFTINGRNTFLRGTLECCIFPKTGHPADRRGIMARVSCGGQGAWPEQPSLSFLVPARSGLSSAADELGHVLSRRMRLVGQRLHHPGRWQAGRRLDLRGSRSHPAALRQPPVVRPDALRQRAGRRSSQGVPEPDG